MLLRCVRNRTHHRLIRSSWVDGELVAWRGGECRCALGPRAVTQVRGSNGKMFNLAVLRDTVRILPEDFNRDPLTTITDALNRKYANKVPTIPADLVPKTRSTTIP